MLLIIVKEVDLKGIKLIMGNMLAYSVIDCDPINILARIHFQPF